MSFLEEFSWRKNVIEKQRELTKINTNNSSKLFGLFFFSQYAHGQNRGCKKNKKWKME
jgi:hypothetical protein